MRHAPITLLLISVFLLVACGAPDRGVSVAETSSATIPPEATPAPVMSAQPIAELDTNHAPTRETSSAMQPANPYPRPSYPGPLNPEGTPLWTPLPTSPPITPT